MPQPPPTSDTQSTRRVKYGLNVLVAAVAAVAIVALINWISYNHFRTGAARWDLTSTRQYSLSPLTQKVLNNIDQEHRIVTLLDASEDAREDTRRAKDLLDEYDRASEHIVVEHIDAATDIERRESFEQELHARFDDELEPIIEAIDEGRAHLRDARDALKRQAELIDEVLNSNEGRKMGRTQLTLALREVQRNMKDLAEAVSEFKEEQDAPLPRYGVVLKAIIDQLKFIDHDFYPRQVKPTLDAAIEQSSTPAGVKDAFLSLVMQPASGQDDRLLGAIQKAVKNRLPYLQKASKLELPEGYNELTVGLNQPNPIVIQSPTGVQVVNVRELFQTTQLNDDDAKEVSRDATERQFLGEEKLTGALARLTVAQLTKKPMVVFVSLGQAVFCKAEGYKQLQDRLRAMNFDVRTWTTPHARNQMTPPGQDVKMPEPAEGQKVVWVLLPGDVRNPENPIPSQSPELVIKQIRERLDEGDSLLAFAPPETDLRPLQQLVLEEWGIAVDSGRVIFRTVLDQFHELRATSLHATRNWPDELALSKALNDRGLLGGFDWCGRIVIAEERTNTSYWPIAFLEHESLWANASTQEQLNEKKKIEYTEGADVKPADGRFNIGYAAEFDDGETQWRLVVIASADWARDAYGTRTVIDPRTRRQVSTSEVPANHELFVNSVYWLVGLDELIAASPRTQDVRRITEVTDGGVRALRATLLIGMPLGVLAIGMGVWFTRRG